MKFLQTKQRYQSFVICCQDREVSGPTKLTFCNIANVELLDRTSGRKRINATTHRKSSVTSIVPNRGGIPPRGGISWVQGRNFHLMVNLPTHCSIAAYFFLKLTLALSISYITLYLWVIYWTITRFLLTNFRDIISQQIVFGPLLLTKFL